MDNTDDHKKHIDILDELMEKLQQGEIIFGNPSQSKKLQYENYEREEKSFKKEGICVCEGCSKPSIKNSHTISKSSSLKYISENRHVYHPYINIRSKDFLMKMGKVGINEATVINHGF